MSFFFNNLESKKITSKKKTIKLASDYGCLACPMNNDKSLINPKLEPTGSDKPILYFLGEYVNSQEDSSGIHLNNDFLRNYIEELFDSEFIKEEIRWNSCVRCNPRKLGKERKVDLLEVSCCKSSIIKDIEETKPKIVVGFGTIPLVQFAEGKMISLWRGRIFPITIGKHDCYYAAIQSPYELKTKNSNYESEEEATFKLDINNIGKFIEKYEEPIIIKEGYTKDIKIITNLKDIKSSLEYFKNKPKVAIDIETWSPEKAKEKQVRPFSNSNNKIVTCAIGDFDSTIAFPVNHPDFKISTLPYLKDFILNSGTKIAHSLKFELEWFNWFMGEEVIWETKWDDTQAQAYILDERTHKDEGQFNLDILIFRNFGFYLKILNSHINKANILENKVEDVLLYNGMDSKYEFLLDMVQQERFDDIQKELYKHMINIEKSTINAQTYGMLVDKKVLNDYDIKISEKIDYYKNEISKQKCIKDFIKIYGEFNPNSSDHLKKLFKNILKMPELKQTKGGKSGKKQFAVDEFVITEYDKMFKEKGNENNIASFLLPYTSQTTLKNTFIESTKENLYDDGKIHTNFGVTFTSTGRINHSSLNIAQFPNKKGKDIRNIMAAPEGFSLVAVDYGQLEARVLAMVSLDKVYIEALWNNLDIHEKWAKRIAEIDSIYFQNWLESNGYLELNYDKQIGKFRSFIKNQWVFALFYGAYYGNLAKSMRLDDHTASILFDEFKKEYSGVFEWHDKAIKFYKEHGYIESPTGRRRHAPLSKNALINLPIQASGSDIVTDAGYRLSKIAYMKKYKYLQYIFNIHDDLTFIIPDENLEEDIITIATEMCRPNFDWIILPLSVEVSVGKSWGSMEEVGKFFSNDFFDYQGEGIWIEK